MRNNCGGLHTGDALSSLHSQLPPLQSHSSSLDSPLLFSSPLSLLFHTLCIASSLFSLHSHTSCNSPTPFFSLILLANSFSQHPHLISSPVQNCAAQICCCCCCCCYCCCWFCYKMVQRYYLCRFCRFCHWWDFKSLLGHLPQIHHSDCVGSSQFQDFAAPICHICCCCCCCWSWFFPL